jgi:hypothetical protein
MPLHAGKRLAFSDKNAYQRALSIERRRRASPRDWDHWHGEKLLAENPMGAISPNPWMTFFMSKNIWMIQAGIYCGCT